MKLAVILEAQAEFIPRASAQTQTVEDIAGQLIRVAHYKGGGNPAKVRKIAHTMADAFASKLAQAVDRELQYSQMKSVDEVM